MSLLYKLNRFVKEFLSGQAQSYGVVPVFKQGQNHSFLIIQHRAGHWDFPKGHPEPGETPLQTAARELREETGLQNPRLMTTPTFAEDYTFKLAGRNIHKNVTYFIAIVADQKVKIQAIELKDYKWVSFEEGLEVLTYDQARKVLREIWRLLRFSQ